MSRKWIRPAVRSLDCYSHRNSRALEGVGFPALQSSSSTCSSGVLQCNGGACFRGLERHYSRGGSTAAQQASDGLTAREAGPCTGAARTPAMPGTSRVPLLPCPSTSAYPTSRSFASSSSGKSIDAAEAEKFGAQAAEWWRTDGPFAMLHSMNPIRCSFIRQSLCSHFRLDPDSAEPLHGLKILDVGCGGGLLSESLARMGAEVTGVDATSRNIRIAETHAASDPLIQERITYRAEAIEDLAEAGEEFDAVMCLEVIEHVAGPSSFCEVLGTLTKNGGALVMSTMNRTPLSYAVAILGAEYITRVVPQGTHDWERFVCPEELTIMLRGAGMQPSTAAGMKYNPLNNTWRLGDDLSVNYIATYVKELQEKPAECSKGFPGMSGGSSEGSPDPAI